MAPPPGSSPAPELASPYLASLTASLNSPNPPSPAALIDIFTDLEPEAEDLVNALSDSLISSYYTSYFLSLILDGDLSEARFLSQRMNQQFFAKDVQTQKVHTVLKSLWSKNYPIFYETMLGTTWDDIVTPLANKVLENTRQTLLSLLQKAYTTIPPSRARIYLGHDTDETTIATLVQQHAWTYDQANELLSPPPKTLGIMNTEKANTAMTAEDVSKMAKLVGLVGRLSDL